jgi:hypothetical protein
MMYAWPRLGPTFVSWLSATPATPAMPDPRPNVRRSTQPLRIPIARAIPRFWRRPEFQAEPAYALRHELQKCRRTISVKNTMYNRLRVSDNASLI